MFRNTYRLHKPLVTAIAVVALAVPATSAAYPDYYGSPGGQDAAQQRGHVDHRSADAQDSAIDAQRGVSRTTLSPSYTDHRSADAQDSAIDAQRGVSRTTLSPAPPKTVQASGSDFDWGDAGIGAGSVFGLLLIVLSGTYALVHRRSRSVEGPGRQAVST